MDNQIKKTVTSGVLLLTAIIIACAPPNPPSSETDIKTAGVLKEEQQIRKNRLTMQEIQKQNKETAKPISIMRTPVSQQKNPYVDADITTKIIPSINNTFGYEIHIAGSSLMQVIHQPNMPGMSGNEGFGTKESAQKVADFVVQKIRRNEMPPIVKITDLKDLDILK